jgi:hypothetical protein
MEAYSSSEFFFLFFKSSTALFKKKNSTSSGLNRLNLTILWMADADVDGQSGTRRIDRKGRAPGT